MTSFKRQTAVAVPNEYGKVKYLERANQTAVAQGVESWGWLPAIAVTSAVGWLAVALADSSARTEYEWAPILMYAGLLSVFVPVAARLLSAAPARRERIGLVLMLGLGLYFVKLLQSPLSFSYFDELLHWRTAHDLLETRHLFRENSLLPVSPLYPGLEIVTNALMATTGWDIFQAGVFVTGAARLLLLLSLFLCFEAISRSSRFAGIAALLYMANPHFVFFDAQFAYESLALPLSAFAVFMVADRLQRHESHVASTLATLLVLVAVVVTHHLTSFVLIAFFALLPLTRFFQKESLEEQSGLVWIALFGLATSLIWLILIATPVISYLTPYTVGAVRELIRMIMNEVNTRPLFTDYAGQTTPVWERATSLGAVALILSGLPWGLIQIWRHFRNHPIALVLGAASLGYGATLPLRLIPIGADVSARSSEYLFLAVAFVLAIGPVQHWLSGNPSRKRIGAATLWAVVLFLGGYVLGAGPAWARLPGPYLVSADMRSIEPEGIGAANWALSFLGPHNRMAADRINGLLMGSYGLQRPITHVTDNVYVAPLYFSSQLGPDAKEVLTQGNVQYVLVDLRLSTALPRVGVYFEAGEPDSFQHRTPLLTTALTKFDHIENVSRVFDSGDIVIYNTGALVGEP